MASMQSAPDVNVHVRSDNSASERRVNPSWTIAHFKTRLEPITGIPSTAQRLALKLSDAQPAQPIEAADEDAVQLANWPLQQYAEIYVHDTRPAHMRTSYTDTSLVDKYEMPHSTYESLSDSVLAWKREQKLGRFDPSLPSTLEQQAARLDRDIAERGIVVGARCKLLPPPPATTPIEAMRRGQTSMNVPPEADDRRGEVRYVGDVPEIPGVGKWIGVALDEPTGKNDGSVKGTRYFDCGNNCGVFLRAERVEVGDFAPLDDFDENMEEM